MATITIQRTAVRNLLHSESTNASRTFVRNDGVSDFEEIVIDKQADNSLDGAWREVVSKLTEKMHEFLNEVTSNITQVQFSFMATEVPDGIEDNLKMCIVDYMMADWLASVRPDFRQRYLDRYNAELDDLLRKLYKKEPPV